MKRRMKRHAVTQPLDQSYKIIPLTLGKNALVDAADFDWLDQWNWTASWNPTGHSFYAKRKNGNLSVYMHREVLGCKPSEHCDHVNHNGLDNRKNNLRKCTRSQNQSNRKAQANNVSGFKGVYWSKWRKKWCAQVVFNKHRLFIAYFDSAIAAAEAYDIAARKYHGEFAHINSPSK